jgi:hypothetical protein
MNMQSAWESARAVAADEAMHSGLPGYYNGPADAARHIIGAAEVRRHAGIAVAWIVVNGNEWLGEASGHRRELIAMDHANNAIGLAIGARAQSYAEVVALARDVIQQGIATAGTGKEGTPIWRPQVEWGNPATRTDLPPPGVIEWRQRLPGGGTYRFGGSEHGFPRGVTPRQAEARRLHDLASVPPEAWSGDDVRAVSRSRPYQDSADPTRSVWHDRVRAYFEAKQAREAGSTRATNGLSIHADDGHDGAGGVVDVAAYVRQGQHGPIHVSAHQRAAPE